jgi:hypothetical protein
MNTTTTITGPMTATPPSAQSGHFTPEPPSSSASSAGPASRLAFWTALFTSASAAAALAIGISTPPRSGPNCLSDCITYPYTDAAAFVPRDYLWMYPAALVAALFVVLVVCIHHTVPEAQQRFSLIGLVFAVIAATVLVADYVVQLTVLQPSLMKGETAALSLISQYNPHGVFIALEDVGYLTSGLALLCTGLAFTGQSWLQRVLRWLLVGGGVAAVAALVGLAVAYGADLEYRFEVIGIGIDWLVLIVAGLLLSVVFRPNVRGLVAPARSADLL